MKPIDRTVRDEALADIARIVDRVRAYEGVADALDESLPPDEDEDGTMTEEAV